MSTYEGIDVVRGEAEGGRSLVAPVRVVTDHLLVPIRGLGVCST